MFKAKRLLQFKLKVFPRGHTPTNYSRWFSSKEAYHVSKRPLCMQVMRPLYMRHIK